MALVETEEWDGVLQSHGDKNCTTNHGDDLASEAGGHGGATGLETRVGGSGGGRCHASGSDVHNCHSGDGAETAIGQSSSTLVGRGAEASRGCECSVRLGRAG